jgi:hypothetical protein
VKVAGKTMHWYYVSPNLNEGYMFAGHLVVLWSESGHTCVYGFHVDYGNDGLSTFAAVHALDLELVRHLGARTITNEKAAGPRYRAMTSGGSVAPRVGTWLAVTSAIHASATTPAMRS